MRCGCATRRLRYILMSYWPRMIRNCRKCCRASFAARPIASWLTRMQTASMKARPEVNGNLIIPRWRRNCMNASGKSTLYAIRSVWLIIIGKRPATAPYSMTNGWRPWSWCTRPLLSNSVRKTMARISLDVPRPSKAIRCWMALAARWNRSDWLSLLSVLRMTRLSSDSWSRLICLRLPPCASWQKYCGR